MTFTEFDKAGPPSKLSAVSDLSPPKRSPLHEAHLALNARMVPFAGWEMPVQYKGIVDEHKAVRERVGVFDISHMGQFLIEGTGAEVFLNRALTNNVTKLAVGQGQYTLLLNDQGGVIDDLIVYRLSEQVYFLVVNASMIDEDRAQLESLGFGGDVKFADLSDSYGGIAVQGPLGRELFAGVFGSASVFPEHNTISSSDSRYYCGTGYTGEEGFEFFAPVAEIRDWFEKLVAKAVELGGMACALGARDTLRLEMGYPLNGNDLAPDKTPLQAGLGFFVDLEKGDFVGRDALLAQKAAGLPTRLTGFRMTSTSPPPRSHYGVCYDGNIIAEICSGGLSPSLGYGIGMAYLPLEIAKVGTPLEIEIRGKRYAAETVKKPFYRKPTP